MAAKQTVIEKPFVYGTSAFWLGKGAEDEHSHSWMIYVRGLENEDLGYYVRSVTFTLHQTFKNHIRVIEKAPFEVNETGWGEFGIKIAIQFHDLREPPIVFNHVLKLFPDNKAQQSIRKPVISENYDEFVFVNPSEAFKLKLLGGPQGFLEHQMNQHWKNDTFIQEQQAKTIKELTAASAKIHKKTDELRAKLWDVEHQIEQLKT